MPRPRKADEASKYASIVREMSHNGTSQRAIAQALKISQSTVSRLLTVAPVTPVDLAAKTIAARRGYHATAQARHDAFHAESPTRVADLTRRLAEIEANQLFHGPAWSGVPESDELCKFFNHGTEPWS